MLNRQVQLRENDMKRNLSFTIHRVLPGLLVFLLLNCSQQARAAKGQCLVLEQNGKSFGSYQVFVAPTAVKLINKGKNIVSIARLKDSKVFMYNTELKLIYETDLKNWKPQLAQRLVFLAGESMDPKAFRFKGRDEIAGLKTKKFVAEEVLADTTMMLKGSRNKARPLTVGIRNKTLWTLDGEEIPEPLTSYLSKVYALPSLGLPIRFSAVMENKRTAYMCDTQKASRVPLSSVDFSAPKGYKRVKSDGALYLDNTSHQLLEFMH
ncbi:MAG: hypothetical protein C0469_04360 [Cyanobacteria bacterium DS2.3.42]|nr:hypothetical protein [Cyanobacteria bacterium DS2.3.42]